MDFGPPELIIVVVLILVLFGGSQLPKLAKNLGKAQAEFKQAMSGKDGKDETGGATGATGATTDSTVAETPTSAAGTAPSTADA